MAKSMPSSSRKRSVALSTCNKCQPNKKCPQIQTVRREGGDRLEAALKQRRVGHRREGVGAGTVGHEPLVEDEELARHSRVARSIVDRVHPLAALEAKAPRRAIVGRGGGEAGPAPPGPQMLAPRAAPPPAHSAPPPARRSGAAARSATRRRAARALPARRRAASDAPRAHPSATQRRGRLASAARSRSARCSPSTCERVRSQSS